MGAGGSLEAAYSLAGPIPAGTWGLIGDGILLGDAALSVDVRFEVVWRQQGQKGGGQVLSSFTHHFVRDPNHRFSAVAYADSALGVAADAKAGDPLVLRMSVQGGDPGAQYEPDGDGKNAGGRIPRLDVPR